MKKILFSNRKGGVGKTTDCLNLGLKLAENSKVLFVDLDDQNSLSDFFLEEPISKYIETAIIENDISSNVINFEENPNISLIKCKRASNLDLFLEDYFDDCLSMLFNQLNTEFDYILIDTRASLGKATKTGIKAVDMVIIPITPDMTSYNATVDTIKTVKNGGKPFKMLKTKWTENRNLTKEITNLFTQLGDNYHTMIHDGQAVKDSYAEGKTTLKKGRLNDDFTELAKEIKDEN